MRWIGIVAACVLLSASTAAGQERRSAHNIKPYTVEEITPILLVDEIEPSISFWERLGFMKTAEASAEGGGLGFAMFTMGGVSVMYQTRASLEGDAPALLGDAATHTQILFVIVEDLDDTIKRLEGADVIVPERKTFYGMREIGVREPGGHAILFAQRLEQE
jgi:uncharacterized glyoxalase superfamily protein PhnB